MRRYVVVLVYSEPGIEKEYYHSSYDDRDAAKAVANFIKKSGNNAHFFDRETERGRSICKSLQAPEH